MNIWWGIASIVYLMVGAFWMGVNMKGGSKKSGAEIVVWLAAWPFLVAVAIGAAVGNRQK